MFRLAYAILLGVLIVAPASAADAKKIIVRWHGQSFFEIITPKGTRIVIDPHLIPAYGRNVVKADLVCMTHQHTDHTQTSVVENLKDAKELRGLKDAKGDGKVLSWNAIDQEFKDVKVRTLGTYHDKVEGMKRGLNSIFIFEIDGLKFAHLGDLGHELSAAQLKKLGEVDVLFVPVGGVYTLNGEDAAKVVEKINPRRYIIPMHYGTPVYDDLLTADEFLDYQKKENIKKYRTNELQIDPSAKVPDAPEVSVLHWESPDKPDK
jgi:L-ascorbate metabolism protein UlaG (beta-lactamase superfamily)